MKTSPYSPKRKLMSLVSVPEYEIKKGVIVGILDGRHDANGERKGDCGAGEIYIIRGLSAPHKNKTCEVWPEFVETYVGRGKA